jgi:hypothetical protein
MLFVYLEKGSAAYVAVLMLGMGLLYVMLGPLFVRGIERHKARREGPASEDCE